MFYFTLYFIIGALYTTLMMTIAIWMNPESKFDAWKVDLSFLFWPLSVVLLILSLVFNIHIR